MKSPKIITVIILSILIGPIVSAFTPYKPAEINPKLKMAEKNLLEGLKSDNLGLQISSAYYLGEFKMSNSTFELMRILRNEDNNECLRIMAALSLIKIGDERGIYLVKWTAKNDDNIRVKNMCAKFYYATVFQKLLK